MALVQNLFQATFQEQFQQEIKVNLLENIKGVDDTSQSLPVDLKFA